MSCPKLARMKVLSKILIKKGRGALIRGRQSATAESGLQDMALDPHGY